MHNALKADYTTISDSICFVERLDRSLLTFEAFGIVKCLDRLQKTSVLSFNVCICLLYEVLNLLILLYHEFVDKRKLYEA